MVGSTRAMLSHRCSSVSSVCVGGMLRCRASQRRTGRVCKMFLAYVRLMCQQLRLGSMATVAHHLLHLLITKPQTLNHKPPNP